MNDDIRVPRNLLIDLYRLIQGRAGRGNEEAIRAINDIDALLAAPPAAQPTGDGARLVSALVTMAYQFDCMHPDVIKTTMIQASNWIEQHNTQTAQPDKARNAGE